MKYIIYLRVSTDEQDNRTQEQKCLKFLKANDPTDFKYEIYSDKITSRKSLEDRPGIMAALWAVGKGDVFVGQKIDRLARNAYEAHHIQRILDMKKADLILVDQPGIKNKVIFGVYAGIAEEEGKAIRARIRDKMEAKKERNERVSGRLPYGYNKLDQNKLVEVNGPGKTKVLKPGLLLPESSEQLVLAQMFQWFDEGMSCRNIALELEKLGYKNREGKPFQHMSIYRILRRTGRTRPKGQPQEVKEFQLSH
jgi:DNA invertase Pin-like site-specific DNA recombinase